MKITREQLRSLILEAAHDLDEEEFEEEEEETESQEQKIAKLMSSSADGYAQAKELLQSLDIDFADYVRKNPSARRAVIENEFGNIEETFSNDLVNALAKAYRHLYDVIQKKDGEKYSHGLNVWQVMNDLPTMELEELELEMYMNVKPVLLEQFKQLLFELFIHSVKPGEPNPNF